MDLGCPLLRGSFVRRLRRRAATAMLNSNYHSIIFWETVQRLAKIRIFCPYPSFHNFTGTILYHQKIPVLSSTQLLFVRLFKNSPMPFLNWFSRVVEKRSNRNVWEMDLPWNSEIEMFASNRLIVRGNWEVFSSRFQKNMRRKLKKTQLKIK